MNMKNNILKKLFIGLLLTFLISAAMLIYGYAEETLFVLIIGIILSVVFSKGYLLFLSSKRTVGVVTDIDVKVFMKRAKSATDKMTSPIIDEKNPAHGAHYERMIILSIKTAKGKIKEKAFHYDDITESIKIGDRIAFSIFDKYPTIVK